MSLLLLFQGPLDIPAAPPLGSPYGQVVAQTLAITGLTIASTDEAGGTGTGSPTGGAFPVQ